MSTCYLIAFGENGTPTGEREYANSWGCAALIWTALFDKYVEKEHEYESWISEKSSKKLWALQSDPRLNEIERTVLFSTFDNCIVKREQFVPLARMFREFSKWHAKPSQVNHLPAMADHLEEMPDDVIAVGWHHTSVSENPWSEYDPDLDECKAYDINTGEKHWLLEVPTPLPECEA